MRFRIGLNRGTALCAVGLAAALGAAAASVVYVNAERLDVVDAKMTAAGTVATVQRNAPLNVIAQEGKWYKVEVGGKQGYVYSNSVSAKPGSGKGKGVSLAAVKSGPIPELDSAAAVKGVGEGTKQYASSGRLNTSGLEELIRRRNALTSTEFAQFLKAGPSAGVAAAANSIPDDTALAANGGAR